MNELQLVGYTADLTHLVFADAPGAERFRVPLDDGLLATVDEVIGLTRPEVRSSGSAPAPPIPPVPPSRAARGLLPGTGTLAAIGMLMRRATPGEEEGAPTRDSKLSPREIQALLRAGKTPKQVAQLAGTHEELVQRWLAPIEAEREQILVRVQQQRLTKARLGPSREVVGDAVRRNLAAKSIAMDDDDAQWLVFRRDGDDIWTVELRYRSRGRMQRARYRYDPETDVLEPRNDLATEIAWVRGHARGRGTATTEATVKKATVKKATFKKATVKKATVKKATSVKRVPGKDAPGRATKKVALKRVVPRSPVPARPEQPADAAPDAAPPDTVR